ncbi:MAG TPA: hypothetical protein VKX17_13300 [Planctomycetota bacterium]|nr:hypothetical protein [Planctomycetota bacterium]
MTTAHSKVLAELKRTKPLAQITDDALRVLCREFGFADTARFLGQFSPPGANYTEERRAALERDTRTVDDIVKELKKWKKSAARKRGP